MNKEQIDEVIKIIISSVEVGENYQDFATAMGEISKVCKNQETKNKIGSILNEFEKNKAMTEELMSEIPLLYSEISEDIQSQLPKDLLEYFYAEVYGSGIGLDEVMGIHGEKKEKAKLIWKKRIDERIDGTTDDEKLKIAEEFVASGQKQFGDMVLLQLSDSKKIELVRKMQNDWDKVKIINTMKDFNMKLKVLQELNDWAQEAVIKAMENPEQREEALSAIQKEEKKKMAIEAMKTLDDESKLNVLENVDEEQRLELVKTIQNPEVVLKAIDKLKIKNKDVLERLFRKNKDVVRDIDIRLLDDRYIKTLGEDKINLISCYPDIQLQILNLNERNYEVFTRCLNCYLQRAQTEEWTVVASGLLTSLQSGQYSELIANIEDLESVDIEKLSKIFQLPNDLEIKTVEDIKNYEEIKRKKCDKIISGNGSLDEKKKAAFLKIFGQDLSVVKTIIHRYGEDIQSIDDGVEKDYVEALKAMMAIKDEETLKQIYNECEDIGLIDTIEMERKLKTAYAKKFYEGLYQPKEEDIIAEENMPEELKKLGLKVYDVGTEFKMIITSVSSSSYNGVNDFKKAWNRPEIKSQHFCASYIRNDMQGTASAGYLCYGFCQMREDALMQAGHRDIDSSVSGFTPKAKEVNLEKYYSPDNMINKTSVYNEMTFRRTQGGDKKQPDYIVAFRENGKIDNVEDIIKAVNDWGGEVPIVIVDRDKCLEAEREQVDRMLKEYEASKNTQKAKEILQKVKNNRNTDIYFCNDIDLQLEAMGRELRTQEDLKQNYDNVTTQERKECISAIKKLQDKIQERGSKKEGEDIEQ